MLGELQMKETPRWGSKNAEQELQASNGLDSQLYEHKKLTLLTSERVVEFVQMRPIDNLHMILRDLQRN